MTLTFEKELAALLNRVSAEAGSDTPDFILAAYLTDCLRAFEVATRRRERWWGRPALAAYVAELRARAAGGRATAEAPTYRLVALEIEQRFLDGAKLAVIEESERG